MDTSAAFRFRYRSYQQRVHDALFRAGKKRLVMVWHRRSGKDRTTLNLMALWAIQRPGTYYFFYPTYAQGKKILWDGRTRPEDPTGKGSPVLDDIPEALIVSKNETEMQITVRVMDIRSGRDTGLTSIIQIVGTDNMDSIVGTNPLGCAFSEYALQDPRAWDFVRPILRENGGWAIFLYTPRGRNHGYRLYDMARSPANREEWFCELLTVNDTRRDGEGESGLPVVSAEDIEKELREGMDPDLIQQEYFCSWTGALQGAYYGRQLELARADGRITRVPWNPRVTVGTAWDLGIGDQNAIWFYQVNGDMVDLIDYHETTGWGVPEYAKFLKEKPYAYAPYHLAPHDIEHREWGSGRKRKDIARDLGIKFRTAPKLKVDEGISAVRVLFSRLRFDEEKCSRGIDALASYFKEWDPVNACFKNQPVHNWASHGADALRTLALGFHEPREARPTHARTAFNPLEYEHEFDPLQDVIQRRR